MVGEFGKWGSRRCRLRPAPDARADNPSRASTAEPPVAVPLGQALDHGRSLTAPVRRCTLGAEADRQVEGVPTSRTGSPTLFGAGSLSMSLREYN